MLVILGRSECYPIHGQIITDSSQSRQVDVDGQLDAPIKMAEIYYLQP